MWNTFTLWCMIGWRSNTQWIWQWSASWWLEENNNPVTRHCSCLQVHFRRPSPESTHAKWEGLTTSLSGVFCAEQTSTTPQSVRQQCPPAFHQSDARRVKSHLHEQLPPYGSATGSSTSCQRSSTLSHFKSTSVSTDSPQAFVLSLLRFITHSCTTTFNQINTSVDGVTAVGLINNNGPHLLTCAEMFLQSAEIKWMSKIATGFTTCAQQPIVFTPPCEWLWIRIILNWKVCVRSLH